LARTWNKIKNKINKYCSFAPEIQLKFLSADLRLNLSQCLDDMVPFRLYQMEKMVIRSEDASIMMNVVIPAKDKHTIFNRDLCDKYNYECKTEKYLTIFKVYLKLFAYNVAFLHGKRFVSILYILST